MDIYTKFNQQWKGEVICVKILLRNISMNKKVYKYWYPVVKSTNVDPSPEMCESYAQTTRPLMKDTIEEMRFFTGNNMGIPWKSLYFKRFEPNP